MIHPAPQSSVGEAVKSVVSPVNNVYLPSPPVEGVSPAPNASARKTRKCVRAVVNKLYQLTALILPSRCRARASKLFLCHIKNVCCLLILLQFLFYCMPSTTIVPMPLMKISVQNAANPIDLAVKRIPPPTAYGLAFQQWEPVAMKSKDLSSRSCSDFVLYTVVVVSSLELSRLMPSAALNTSSPECAFMLMLQVIDRAESASAIAKQTSLFREMKARHRFSGWQVLSTSCFLPARLSRRLSRVPKLLPSRFFNQTNILL